MLLRKTNRRDRQLVEGELRLRTEQNVKLRPLVPIPLIRRW